MSAAPDARARIPLHERTIACSAWRRADGLYEVEAQLQVTKPAAVAFQAVVADRIEQACAQGGHPPVLGICLAHGPAAAIPAEARVRAPAGRTR